MEYLGLIELIPVIVGGIGAAVGVWQNLQKRKVLRAYEDGRTAAASIISAIEIYCRNLESRGKKKEARECKRLITEIRTAAGVDNEEFVRLLDEAVSALENAGVLNGDLYDSDRDFLAGQAVRAIANRRKNRRKPNGASLLVLGGAIAAIWLGTLGCAPPRATQESVYQDQFGDHWIVVHHPPEVTAHDDVVTTVTMTGVLTIAPLDELPEVYR